MISVTFNGGLGNQMYQIATTYALALDNGDNCGFNFKVFPIMQGKSPQCYRSTIYKKLNSIPDGWRPRIIYNEKGYNYSPIVYSRDMLLVGYWGAKKYFDHRRGQLIALFKDKGIVDDIKEHNKDILRNSVSVHVRRGDYLALSGFYVMLSADYYKKAIELLDSKTEIENIIVFSDDINWCKANLADERMTFIQYRPDYYDFYLMTLCDHNIIANSSFSWWATYLNENKDKMVIAPRKWFKNTTEEINCLDNPRLYYEYHKVLTGPGRNTEFKINENKIPQEEYVYCDNWILI